MVAFGVSGEPAGGVGILDSYGAATDMRDGWSEKLDRLETKGGLADAPNVELAPDKTVKEVDGMVDTAAAVVDQRVIGDYIVLEHHARTALKTSDSLGTGTMHFARAGKNIVGALSYGVVVN